MNNNSNRSWYVRLNGPKIDLKSACCPKCDAPYKVGPIFDHDPRPCLNCGTTLIEWNMMDPIFIINYNQAPQIVKNIIDYLAPFTEQEADMELLKLLRFMEILRY